MKHYEGIKTKEISFPLGGIGTGSLGLAGNGSFIDWEIFNYPHKGSTNGFSHIAVRAIDENGKIISKVLCGDVLKDYCGQYQRDGYNGFGNGISNNTMQGFPHFENWDFESDFPFAYLHFDDEDFPAKVTLKAFNPFIPIEEDLSSIPAAFFTVEFENKTEKAYRFSAALTVNRPFQGTNITKTVSGGKGVFMQSDSPIEKIEYRDMTVMALDGDIQIQPDWYRGQWQDSIVTFWKEFSKNKTLLNRKYDEITPSSHATVCSEADIKKGETKSFRFVFAWNVPNRINDWETTDGKPTYEKLWKNYYAVKWENSLSSCAFALENFEELEMRSAKFCEIMNSNTLPEEVNEVAIRNLSVLKSPTVLRLEDGSLWGWEGTQELIGSCFGSCTHVWNYTYALCFLFPKLERSLRENAIKYNLCENGKMGFRLHLPIGIKKNAFPCLDGQMGEVIKVYREWKLSGDDNWLKMMWPNTKKVLEYAFVDDGEFSWDADKDGVLEGRQHHTLDMELFGPSGWLEGFYMLALKAGKEMAEFMGDFDSAKLYEKLFEKGSKYTEKELFNGSYYIQKVDICDKAIVDKFNVAESYWNSETGEIKYQIANGCEIDQLVAQWHSNICGLGDVFDKDNRKTALKSLYKNNFKPTMRHHANPWRIFAVNGEAGTIMCDYPDENNKPQVPLPYTEECMTGFEYALAGLMISEGMINEGLELVRAVRDRYDGEKRNPFNEIECGSNYARSMASFSLIPIFSGFKFDMPKKEIGFAPIINKDNFSCLFACADTWGKVNINQKETALDISFGTLNLNSFITDKAENVSKIICDGKEITDYKKSNGKIEFSKEISVLKSLCFVM